jgi:hypothetical protein
MLAHRPEKATVRGLWMDKLDTYHTNYPPPELLYVFLPGAEGHEIELLARIIRREAGFSPVW